MPLAIHGLGGGDTHTKVIVYQTGLIILHMHMLTKLIVVLSFIYILIIDDITMFAYTYIY